MEQPGVAPVLDRRKPAWSFLRANKLVVWAIGIIGGLLALMMIGAPPQTAPTDVPNAPVATAGLSASPETVESWSDSIRRLTAATQAAAAPEQQPVPVNIPALDNDEQRPYQQPAAPQEDPTKAAIERLKLASRLGSDVVRPRGQRQASQSVRAVAAPPVDSSVDIEPPQRPSLDAVAEAVARAVGVPQQAPVTPQATPAQAPAHGGIFRPRPERGLHRISPGTTIETTLEHRLEIGGPVDCLVSVDVYAHDLTLVIPKGSKVLGQATPVQTTGESRLAVAFHTVVFPDGSELPIDNLVGMNQLGDVGLKDKVNNHYVSSFAAAGAIGLISGFSQFLGGGFGSDRGGVTIITGDIGNSASQATSQAMQRFLNRLPTITIREGHRVRVYLRNNLDLPAWRAQ